MPTVPTVPVEAPPAAPTTVAVRLDHYAIEADTFSTTAGPVTVAVENLDGVPHDATLLRTALAAEELPTTGIRVDEANAALQILGRTPRLAAGESGTFTVSLTPGTYVLVCTVPHHYVREAMAARLTVVG